jgi:hypothetical protein
LFGHGFSFLAKQTAIVEERIILFRDEEFKERLNQVGESNPHPQNRLTAVGSYGFRRSPQGFPRKCIRALEVQSPVEIKFPDKIPLTHNSPFCIFNPSQSEFLSIVYQLEEPLKSFFGQWKKYRILTYKRRRKIIKGWEYDWGEIREAC